MVKQQASTSDMISSTFEVVAEASKFMTLEPGDVILTGTCAGVGHPHGDYLQVGDDMEVRIEKVGSLSNPIVAPTASVMSS